MSDLSQPQPKPGQADVTEFILAALRERQKRGRQKYGTSLQTWNGRDAYADAIEEELDRLQYLTQARLERAELLEMNSRLRAANARLLTRLSRFAAWLDVYEDDTRALPPGLQDASRGSSVYNWRMAFVRECRAALAADAPKGEEISPDAHQRHG